MADLSITASSVVKGVGATTANGIAGATITAGQPLYIDTANSDVIKLADANSSDLTSTVCGISLHGASTGQPITYITYGPLTVNAVLTTGAVYVASATAGSIAPTADLTTGWRTSILGYASSTTVLNVRLTNSLVTN